MKNHSSRFLQLVTDSKPQIKETNPDQIQQKLLQKQPFFLIDVREESEWAEGHLPNAIHLSKGIIERDIEKVIPDSNAAIVLYCGGGYRSLLAASNIQKMGYTNVESMAGGYRGWLSAGYSISSEKE